MVILHQTLLLFCFLFNAMSTEGAGALNMSGQHSFSCNKKAGKGKERSIYKAIEDTVVEPFALSVGADR